MAVNIKIHRFNIRLINVYSPTSHQTFANFSQSVMSEFRDLKEEVKSILNKIPDINAINERVAAIKVNYKLLGRISTLVYSR